MLFWSRMKGCEKRLGISQGDKLKPLLIFFLQSMSPILIDNILSNLDSVLRCGVNKILIDTGQVEAQVFYKQGHFQDSQDREIQIFTRIHEFTSPRVTIVKIKVAPSFDKL